MKRLALIACLLAPTPAIARDARITTRFYDPAVVVEVHGRTGIESTIEFNSDEQIENIAVGDSATWQVTPNKGARLLFVKPIKAGVHCNLTVVTNKRTYFFDLLSTGTNVPLYSLRFTYPAPPKPVVVPVPVVAKPAPPPAPTPADLNFAWSGEGAKDLLPARMFDDGHATWLAWPKDRTLPAILAPQPDGKDGAVNYTTKGNYIVVDGVPSQLMLRQGKQKAVIHPDSRAAPAASSRPDHATPAATTAERPSHYPAANADDQS